MSAKKAAKKTSAKAEAAGNSAASRSRGPTKAKNVTVALPATDEKRASQSSDNEPDGDSASPGMDQSGGVAATRHTCNPPHGANHAGDPDAGVSDRHLRVVEIATQLACAQITAEASMESARLTVDGIQRIAAEFSDLPKPEFLRSTGIHNIPGQKVAPLNHPKHDALFEGAMIRARRLMMSPSEDTSLVHAEQLFDAEEILSETKVGERFAECEWPGLTNRADYYETIVALESWFHDHLGRLYFPEEDERFSEDAEMMGYVLDLGRRRQADNLFRKIYELVREHDLPNRPWRAWTNTDELSHVIWTKHLIDVIFCERQPSKTRDAEKKTIRRYRPWGLFRYLRLHGAEDPDGVSLLERFVAKRNDLKSDALIHPLKQSYPRSYDFGPLDRLVHDKEQGIG